MTGEEGEVVRVDLRTLTWETGCASDKQTGGEGLGEAGEFHFRQVKWEVGSECRVEIRWLDRPVQCWGLDQVETMCSLLADQGSLYVFVICVFCLKWNGPRDALTQKKAGFPCSGLNAGSYFISQDEG